MHKVRGCSGGQEALLRAVTPHARVIAFVWACVRKLVPKVIRCTAAPARLSLRPRTSVCGTTVEGGTARLVPVQTQPMNAQIMSISPLRPDADLWRQKAQIGCDSNQTSKHTSPIDSLNVEDVSGLVSVAATAGRRQNAEGAACGGRRNRHAAPPRAPRRRPAAARRRSVIPAMGSRARARCGRRAGKPRGLRAGGPSSQGAAEQCAVTGPRAATLSSAPSACGCCKGELADVNAIKLSPCHQIMNEDHDGALP